MCGSETVVYDAEHCFPTRGCQESYIIIERVSGTYRGLSKKGLYMSRAILYIGKVHY